MSKKSKQGRGALVRRLRREYGLTEGEARLAVEGVGGESPDTRAAYTRNQKRKINRGVEPRWAYRGWPHECPQRPEGWCTPHAEAMPEQPRGMPPPPGLRGARRRLSSLTAMALALSSGLDRK